ncbi:MAG: chemotaxis protein CheD [Nitrospirae bacterium]|uniref:chemotaxis protein CheD n=1 Tax=Candidatus Magnetobacterium casense TaxID=1455061 RepID=UPI00058BA534|nr:chemotaxis protein CheD [Candidatus Magnetobacterium casensis]MBF0338016.1 chemotaxis protein CheD [Nitrospirota bacterium]
MESDKSIYDHFLYPGNIYVHREPCAITTILGSCVAVCLWDPVLKYGGMNHYLLPLWNGEGLPSPRYGNIAIDKLIEKMLSLGCNKKSLKAKIFGGAAMMQQSSGLLNVGERNIIVAEDVLAEEGISIVSSDVGGTLGRKIVFKTETGGVLLKKVKKTTE